jgi:hypothetical protein
VEGIRKRARCSIASTLQRVHAANRSRRSYQCMAVEQSSQSCRGQRFEEKRAASIIAPLMVAPDPSAIGYLAWAVL